MVDKAREIHKEEMQPSEKEAIQKQRKRRKGIIKGGRRRVG